MDDDKIDYAEMSQNELDLFIEMFSTFQDLILSMIRNAVRALPTDKNNSTPSIKAHIHIKSLSNDVNYEKVIDIKDVFLSCISNTERRAIFANSIQCFILDKNKQIRFYIKKSAYEKFLPDAKKYFKLDIKKLEEEINNINNNFNKRLPEAKKQGLLMISKIKSIDIPDKAKYQGKTKGKGKGI